MAAGVNGHHRGCVVPREASAYNVGCVCATRPGHPRMGSHVSDRVSSMKCAQITNVLLHVLVHIPVVHFDISVF